MKKLLLCITLLSTVLAATDIIVTNDKRCTNMAKYYIENFDATPPELAIIISTCEGIVNPQYSGLGGGFLASIFNGYCENGTRLLNARETSPLAYQSNFPTQYSEIGVPSMLKGYESLYKLNFCGMRLRPALSWDKLFTENIKLAGEGWIKTKNFNKYWKFLGNAKHKFEIQGNFVKNPTLANTLRQIASEGPSSSLYRHNGLLQHIILEDLQEAGSIITPQDFNTYTSVIKYTNVVKCFNYTIVGTSWPGSSFTFNLGCKIVEAAYETLKELPIEDRFMFMYQTLRYMYSIKPHLNALSTLDILDIFANKENIANEIFRTFDQPWDTNAIKNFGSHAVHNTIQHKEEAGTANIIIKRGKYAITMTSTINSYWGSKLSSSLGFFFNDQLKDFDAVGTPNEPKPKSNPQSATSAIVFYSNRKNPVFQIGAAGGSKMIGAIFNTFFNYFVNEMSLKDANAAPRCMPLYKDESETVFCERELGQTIKDRFNHVGMTVKYTKEKFGGVTASSTMRRGPEASHDHRRGGSSWINLRSSYL